MADLQETPAVPPMESGGDERAGLESAGGLLVALGWGLAVVVNVLLHALAPSGGWWILFVRIYPAYGPYAVATLGLGLVTGAVGVGFWFLGQALPRGPLVLPGVEYP